VPRLPPDAVASQHLFIELELSPAFAMSTPTTTDVLKEFVHYMTVRSRQLDNRDLHCLLRGEITECAEEHLKEVLPKKKVARETFALLLAMGQVRWCPLARLCEEELREHIEKDQWLLRDRGAAPWHVWPCDVLVSLVERKLLSPTCVALLCDPAYFFHLFSLASDWGHLATRVWFYLADAAQQAHLALFWHYAIRGGVDVASIMAGRFLASGEGAVLRRGLEVALLRVQQPPPPARVPIDVGLSCGGSV
jgi:hypothetical protein